MNKATIKIAMVFSAMSVILVFGITLIKDAGTVNSYVHLMKILLNVAMIAVFITLVAFAKVLQKNRRGDDV